VAAAGNALVRPLHRPAENANTLSVLINVWNWASLGNIVMMQTLVSDLVLDAWLFQKYAPIYRMSCELCLKSNKRSLPAAAASG
jgi:hypothetical protein